jgi:S1-C subfamily serine protease
MTIHGFKSIRARSVGRLSCLLLAGTLGCCAALPAGHAGESPTGAACTESISDIFDRVSPAVVFITATSINPFSLTDRVERIVGSGFLIDPSGLILTNSHVAFGRQSIRVTLDDGTTTSATLVGADPIFDLALLRIPPSSSGPFPTAAPGDSERVRVGEEVLAIGNPMGLDQTLTRGVVSAINRILPETPYSLMEPLIQTDASINPGSSGGPLLNRCGEVIGIATAIIPEAQGIGFAIPINLAKALLPSLQANGRVVRPWLGFHGQLVDEALRSLLRIPLVDGLLIEVVEPQSPAEQAGLHGGELEIVVAGRSILVGGDIITRLNGVKLDSPDRLAKAMRPLKVGSPIRLTVFRNGEYREVEYTLPERPILPGDFRGERSLLAPMGQGLLPGPPAGSAPKTR